MKKLISTVLAVCALGVLTLTLVGAEKFKLAIVGAEETADLLFAILSENDHFELMEREKIQQLAAEHQLAAVNAAELTKRFPHTDFFVVFRTRDIVFFDAKSGTLAGKFLRGEKDNAEALARELAKKLTVRSACLKKDGPLPPVSIAGVSDSSAPAEFKKEYALCADALERQMVNDTDAVCLERRALGNVNSERELADAAFPLSVSARLIYLEFTQSGKAGTADCAVYLLKPDGTGVTKLYFADVFSGREAEKKAAEMWRRIKQELASGTTGQTVKKPTPRGNSGALEARKIIASIRPDDPPARQIEKYDAAIALNPKKQYRAERLCLLLETLNRNAGIGMDERLARQEEIFRQMIELKMPLGVEILRSRYPAKLTPAQQAAHRRIVRLLRHAAIDSGRAEINLLSKPKQITSFERSIDRLQNFFLFGIDKSDFDEEYVLYLTTLQEFFEEISVRLEWKNHREVGHDTCKTALLFGPVQLWRDHRKIIYTFIPKYEKSPLLLVRSIAERIKFVARMDALKPEEATAERLTRELDAHEIEMQKFLSFPDRTKSLLDLEIRVLAKSNGGVFPDKIVEDTLKKYRNEEKRTFSAY